MLYYLYLYTQEKLEEDNKKCIKEKENYNEFLNKEKRKPNYLELNEDKKDEIEISKKSIFKFIKMGNPRRISFI